MNFRVIAHRGFAAMYPENTLRAFSEAVRVGAHMIELDVQITADQQLVVVHDDDLSRTTDGCGIVEKLTAAEIRSFDAGTWFGPEFAGEKVPFLEEVLQLCEGKIDINIEIKPTARKEVVFILSEMLNRYKERDRLLISSFDIELMLQLKELQPSLSYAYAFLDQALVAQLEAESISLDDRYPRLKMSLEEHIGSAKSLGFRDINFRWSVLNSELVQFAHEEGLKVNCWTVDEPEAQRSMIQCNVDGIITNYPDRLLRFKE